MEDRKLKQVLSWGWYQWEEEENKERCRKVNMVEIIFTHMKNRKMRPVETILRMGEEG
jgi:hypothetical protein